MLRLRQADATSGEQLFNLHLEPVPTVDAKRGLLDSVWRRTVGIHACTSSLATNFVHTDDQRVDLRRMGLLPSPGIVRHVERRSEGFVECAQMGYTRRQISDGIPILPGRIDHLHARSPPSDLDGASIMSCTIGDIIATPALRLITLFCYIKVFIRRHLAALFRCGCFLEVSGDIFSRATQAEGPIGRLEAFKAVFLYATAAAERMEKNSTLPGSVSARLALRMLRVHRKGDSEGARFVGRLAPPRVLGRVVRVGCGLRWLVSLRPRDSASCGRRGGEAARRIHFSGRAATEARCEHPRAGQPMAPQAPSPALQRRLPRRCHRTDSGCGRPHAKSGSGVYGMTGGHTEDMEPFLRYSAESLADF